MATDVSVMPHAKLTREKIELAFSMRLAGKKLHEIAEAIGVGKTQTCRLLRGDTYYRHTYDLRKGTHHGRIPR